MSPPETILIYRLGSLGDIIVTLPCFHLIRAKYPRAKIVLLTNQPVSGKAAPAMAILENTGLVDGAISYPLGTRSWRELAAVRSRIKELQPDLVINLAAGRGWLKSLRDYIFFRSCAVKNIVGTPVRRRDLQVQPAADGLYKPESQRLAARLLPLGTIDLADQNVWKLGLTQDEKKAAVDCLPAKQSLFLAVSVGTKLLANDWGEESWGSLLTRLSEEMPQAGLILLGAAEEWERSEKLSRVWPGASVNLCGKTSPRVSAAILERCRLFIGHDSGPLHLAAAVGIPALGLYSWNNPPGQWFPGHRSWKFIKTLYPELPPGGWHEGLRLKRAVGEGILLLKPEEVFTAAMEMWNSAKR
jgi:ADP-heptose:LPS heptosyltransferase